MMMWRREEKREKRRERRAATPHARDNLYISFKKWKRKREVDW
jgi:hypothetical protein